ncbi:hypothetical protein [Segatella paludivivens]|uniref:hypothetical protein n=1 Tax=Segatella paludivivens TaxID=185294 RepID=UPI0003644F5F|nr:hypothetical protein [Segatella paludivivens]
MNRIFHHRFTFTSKCAIALFTLLAFYFLWNKIAIPALLVVIVIVMMIERVLHTTYTFFLDENGVQQLVIYRGRFSKPKSIRVGDIVKVTRIKAVFGLSCYLLMQYGACHLISLQPDDEELFMAELNKRQ